jgi:fused signal recognition particle receptor
MTNTDSDNSREWAAQAYALLKKTTGRAKARIRETGRAKARIRETGRAKARIRETGKAKARIN